MYIVVVVTYCRRIHIFSHSLSISGFLLHGRKIAYFFGFHWCFYKLEASTFVVGTEETYVISLISVVGLYGGNW